MFSHPQGGGNEVLATEDAFVVQQVRILYMMDKKENHKSLLLILALLHGSVRSDDVEA